MEIVSIEKKDLRGDEGTVRQLLAAREGAFAPATARPKR